MPPPASAQGLDPLGVIGGIIGMGIAIENQRQRQQSPPAVTSRPQPTAPQPAIGSTLSRAEVREVQEGLIELGYNPGTPDGVMGPRTRNAIVAFVVDRGHDSRYIRDSEVMTLLRDVRSVPAAPSFASTPGTPVAPPGAAPRQADAGPPDLVVAEINHRLAALGYESGDDVRVWSVQSAQALAAFLQDNALPLPAEPGDAALAILRLASPEVAFDPTLLAGAQADPVADEIRQLLALLGYDPGTMSGPWTESAQLALGAFLRDRALPLAAEPGEVALGILRLASPSGAVSSPNVGAAGAGQGSSPLAFAAPAGGLRAPGFQRVEGVPIVDRPIDGTSHRALPLLLALGAAPERLSLEPPDRARDDIADLLAVEFLQPEQAAMRLQNRRFRGATEFEIRDNRAGFVAEFRDGLLAMVPRAPFVVAFAHGLTTALPDYDRVAGGFRIPAPIPRSHSLTIGRVLTASPDLLWRVTEGEARELAARFGNREGAGGMRPRSLQPVVFAEVTAIGADGALTIRRLHTDIYDIDLSERLVRLPAPPDIGAGAAAAAASGDLSRFSSPPPGLLPFDVRVDRGRVVIPRGGNNLRDFLAAVRWTAHPLAPQIAQLHLNEYRGLDGDVRQARRVFDALVGFVSPEARRIFFTDASLRSRVPLRFQGEDEFDREETAQRFQRDMIDPLVRWAPGPGLRIVWNHYVELGEYDRERASFDFPLRDWPPSPDQSGNFTIEFVGRPDLDERLAMDAEAARELLARLRRDAPTWRANLPTFLDRERLMGIVHEAEILSVDGESGTIVLRMLGSALTYGDFTTVLREVRIIGAEVLPYARRTIPPMLDVPGVVPLNSPFHAELHLIRAGASTPDEAIRHIDDMRARDAAFHAAPPDVSDWPENDVRLPYWPAGASLNASNVQRERVAEAAALRPWIEAFVAGMSEAAHLSTTMSAEQIGAAMAGGELQLDPFAGYALHEGAEVRDLAARLGVFPDQIRAFRYRSSGALPQVHHLLVTPLRGAVPAVGIPAEVLDGERFEHVRLVTELTISRIEAIEIEGRVHRVVLAEPGNLRVELFDVPPREYEPVTGRGRVIAEYPLHNESTDNAGNIDAGRPMPLTPALTDLLSARLIGDALPDAALIHIALRRWHHEDETRSPIGGHFFAPGERLQDASQALDAGRRFVAWSRALAFEPPAQVVIPAPRVELTPDQREIEFWYGSNAIAMDYMLQQSIDYCSPQLVARGRSDAWSEGQCAFREASNRLYQNVRRIDPPSRGQFNVVDTMTVFHRHHAMIPVPTVEFMGARELRLEGEAVFDLLEIGVTREPVTHRSLFPDALWWNEFPYPVRPARELEGPALVLDLRFAGAQWRDPNETVHNVDPDAAETVAAILEPLRSRGSVSPEPQDVPTRPLAILGITLGSSLAEADRIIRNHMDVAHHVVNPDALRLDSDGHTIRAYTDGRLYIAAGGRELIGIHAEGPAHPDTVVSIWRMMRLPVNAMDGAGLRRSISAQHGEPLSHRTNRVRGVIPGTRMQSDSVSYAWGPADRIFGLCEGRIRFDLESWWDLSSLPEDWLRRYDVWPGLPVLNEPDNLAAADVEYFLRSPAEACAPHLGAVIVPPPDDHPTAISGQEILVVVWLSDLRSYVPLLRDSRAIGIASPALPGFDLLGVGD